MNSKEIFAAIEISDHEVRLIVSELHNLKLNILKVERVSCDGVNAVNIVNEEACITAIKKAVDNASRLLGFNIQRVILVIPSVHMERIAKRIIVDTENGIVSKKDVIRALKSLDEEESKENNEIVQIIPTRYIVNGVTTRKVPIDEKASTLGVEVEILSCDKDIMYQYIGCVEKAHIQVMDICLDTYALSLESGVLHDNDHEYELLFKLERETTTLALFTGNRLVNSTIIDGGYGEFIGAISQKYNLPTEISNRLLLYNYRINKSDLSDAPIYYWTVGQNSHSISEKDLGEIVMPLLDEYLAKIRLVCKDILSLDDLAVILSGEGVEMQNITDYFEQKLEVICRSYIPETLGVRNGALSTLMGAIYAYLDQKDIKTNLVYSADEDEVEKLLKETENVSEDTLTNRFKKLFGKN